MDFLLECIGFSPDMDYDELVDRVRAQGEPAPWRGDSTRHMRLPLGAGLEVRLDREEGQGFWTLLPHFRSHQRLRIAVETLKRVPDSPHDALLTGWACPTSPCDPDPPGINHGPGAYRIAAWIVDASRLHAPVENGHVIAISVAGYALHVDYIGPNDGGTQRGYLDQRRGAVVAPIGAEDAPGGCSEVSLRIQSIRHLRNPLSGAPVDLLVTDAPERPLLLFVNPWQLMQDGHPAPRPGWRIEGAFLFSGTLAGGMPSSRQKRSLPFG